MHYKKFSATAIFDGYRMLPGTAVLVTDENGTVLEITTRADAGDEVLHLDGILCPGFINAHCHLELSHMKGVVPEHTGLVDFVFKIISERHFEEAEILEAISRAEAEMISNGIVAVGDICNNTFTIPQKLKAKLRYHNFIELSGFPPALAPVRFEKANAILSAYTSAFNAAGTEADQYQSTLSPHAPYSVSPALFQLINKETAGKLISIHNQETTAEDDFFRSRSGDFLRLYEKIGIDISFFTASGKSSLQTWLPYLDNKQSVILVHNVTTSADDLQFAQEQAGRKGQPLFFCLCANANLYISNQLPAIENLLPFKNNIVLGTDSLASNHQLSILEEIRTLQKHFPRLELSLLLQWATSNGAGALQMDETLGSFSKGKKPGILHIPPGLVSVNRLL